MDRAPQSYRDPVDDMEKRARYRALSGTLFRNLHSSGIPAIDQRIAAGQHCACVVELMAEHFHALRAQRTGHAKPRASIAQMQPALRERSFESEQTGHLVPVPVGILEAASQHHVATTLAVDRNAAAGQLLKTFSEAVSGCQHASMEFRITARQPDGISRGIGR